MFFIKNIEMSGIKNIEAPIQIEFANKRATTFEGVRESNVKAIYGPNGSGKTAIIHGFDILKNNLVSRNYLQDSKSLSRLDELVNKKTKKIYLKIELLYAHRNNNATILGYEVQIEKMKDGFNITHEKYTTISKSGKVETLAEIVDGEIVYKPKKLDDAPFKNLLNKRSFINVFFENRMNKGLDLLNLDYYLLILTIFGLKMNVVLDPKDTHEDIVKHKALVNRIQNFNSKGMKLDIDLDLEFGYKNRLIDQDELEELKENLSKKETFIKIFKPEIKSIIIEEDLVRLSENDSEYKIREYINYGDYKINVDFESIGIKKLLDLFDYITLMNGGSLLVIDELDSHINDIYLIKLVEYIIEYSKGQLIFTTHNVSPMEVLKKNKFGIDFMSMDGKITKYTQIGNYSPLNLYRSGMIKGLPFNLEKEDFLYAFGEIE